MKRKHFLMIILFTFLASFIYIYVENHIYTKYFIIPLTIEKMTFEINNANVKHDYEIPKKDWDKILDFLKSSKKDHRLEYVSKLEEAISDHTYEYKELYIYTSNKTYVWPLFEYKDRLLLIPGGDIKYFYRADSNLLKYFKTK